MMNSHIYEVKLTSGLNTSEWVSYQKMMPGML
jgi:hypothetical protein